MISEIYDALRDIGVTEEKARKAAEAVAIYDDRFGRIERRLTLLTWQINAIIGLLLLVGAPSVWFLVRIASKVGALG
jgi:hypothetical protein